MKLSEFPVNFDLKDVQKEMFPYSYYTLDRLKSGVVKI